jgi:16S RNA G1207 methylase RsmC
MRHETPSEIASVLARHIPRNPSSILDPCVGNGALLAPVLSRLSWNVAKVTCIDTDASVLGTVRATLSHRLNGKLETRTENFIDWAKKSVKRFDCIVMNPPFCGKRTDWTEIGSGEQRKIPIEGEFVRQAIALLNNNGVLLAVLFLLY